MTVHWVPAVTTSSDFSIPMTRAPSSAAARRAAQPASERPTTTTSASSVSEQSSSDMLGGSPSQSTIPLSSCPPCVVVASFALSSEALRLGEQAASPPAATPAPMMPAPFRNPLRVMSITSSSFVSCASAFAHALLLPSALARIDSMMPR